jgi:hypothetical protein
VKRFTESKGAALPLPKTTFSPAFLVLKIGRRPEHAVYCLFIEQSDGGRAFRLRNAERMSGSRVAWAIVAELGLEGDALGWCDVRS